MKIKVKARPGAKEEKVEEMADGSFAVSVKEPPMQGRANSAIAKALAAHFGVSNSQVRLVSGFASREKLFEILKQN